MEENNKECPKCGATEKQYRNGQNKSGTNKCLCGVCGRRYTPAPMKNAYTEEERQQALKLLVSGMSGRAIGLQMGMSKANAYAWAKKKERGVDK
ncbi:hypothetical protein FACS1894211_12650 [Clostridia bacterium]|nr:hypothetical protein FACS1894211_12650 [Clostridia bacterium]